MILQRENGNRLSSIDPYRTRRAKRTPEESTENLREQEREEGLRDVLPATEQRKRELSKGVKKDVSS